MVHKLAFFKDWQSEKHMYFWDTVQFKKILLRALFDLFAIVLILEGFLPLCGILQDRGRLAGQF